MTSRSRPFYPSQTEAGSTYVVDARNGRVVSDLWDEDLGQRWRKAQRRADSMNNAFERRFYARRRRLTLFVGLALIAVGLWVLVA